MERHAPLPAGFGLALDPATRRIDGGRVVIGGSPLRILRLTAAGADLVSRWAAGGEIGPGSGARRLARRLLANGMAHPRPGPRSSECARVTVVIPVRDDPSGLERTLALLDEGVPTTVVIVDDGSRHPVQASGRVVRRETAGGPAAARNAGFQASATDLIAFIDAGCEPSPGWFDALLPHFADPSVAAVAPRILGRTDAGLPAWLDAYERARPSLDRGPYEASVHQRGRVPFVPTAALVVRRDALQAVGGFDEALRYGEDVDLVWRLVAAGWMVRYEPAATVTHPSRKTAWAWLRQRFAYGTAAAPLASRHGSALAPLSISGWSAAAWTLIGLGFPATGAAVAGATAAMLAPRLEGLEHPWIEAARLAGGGHIFAGRAVADALRRPWWPFALAAAIVSKRARRGVLAAFILPPLLAWRSTRPKGIGPVAWIAVSTLDDVTYGAGVWAGCLRHRCVAALRPDLGNWPGRAPAVES